MIKVRFLPADRTVEGREHMSILQLARKAHVSISTRCDGNAACMMCKVQTIDASGLQAPQQKEVIKLGDEAIQRGIRLACQAKLGGVGKMVVVELPESPLKAAIRAQLAKQQEEDSLW
jgi:2Fe-2S ferredoxin